MTCPCAVDKPSKNQQGLAEADWPIVSHKDRPAALRRRQELWS